MLKTNYTRRIFLKKAGSYSLVFAATASGLALLNGCNGKKEDEVPDENQALPNQAQSTLEKAQEAADPCNNTSDLSEATLQAREEFDYESRSDDGTELCNTCEYWRTSSDDSLCGTCTIVLGPIHPQGTCNIWEEKS